jgi:hypothetical protein
VKSNPSGQLAQDGNYLLCELSLVSTIEELLEKPSSGSGLDSGHELCLYVVLGLNCYFSKLRLAGELFVNT